MRQTRVYVDAELEPGTRIALAGSAASHVTRVLRLRTGETLTLFNGRGGEYAARIDASQRDSVTLAVAERAATERESPLALTLAQGVSRGERMDWVVQKATELGVTAFAPLLTERSVVRLDAQQSGRKLNHWRAIAIAACEQCGRNRLPQIAAPVTLREFLSNPAGGGSTTRTARILLSPAADRRIADLRPAPEAIAVLIGPEGGLTQEEQEAALAAGFIAMRLGPRVLRTETAAVAALSVLQREFGDL